jgi:Circularly permutated YpsA SLOG family
VKCLVQQIVSGGQTGADRAALDWAIENGTPHGGWCPKDRKAEDGTIQPCYHLRETATAEYADRTERNVQDSNGTVIISIGRSLKGGSEATLEFARKHGKPCLHVAASDGPKEAARKLRQFLIENSIHVLNVAGPRASEEPAVGDFVKFVLAKALMNPPPHEDTALADPASLLKAQSRLVSFESCQIWFHGDNVVVDSRVPLPDLSLREFARPRILFEGASYHVSQKSQSSGPPAVYRYVLAPWPRNDSSITRPVALDEEYFHEIAAQRRRAWRESLAFKALVIFYPFLGFLWSPQKRGLNRIGFESHAISSISVYTGFLIGFSCAVFLVVFEFGAKTLPVSLLAGMILFMVDAVARFDRLLANEDPIPPGFYEWLIGRKRTYD